MRDDLQQAVEMGPDGSLRAGAAKAELHLPSVAPSAELQVGRGCHGHRDLRTRARAFTSLGFGFTINFQVVEDLVEFQLDPVDLLVASASPWGFMKPYW